MNHDAPMDWGTDVIDTPRDDSDDFDYTAALRACAAGDRGALARLYEHDADRLLGVAMRIVRDRNLADDVVHEAFLRIWRHAAGFDPRQGSARGWMLTTVRNGALNMVRDRGRELPVDEERLAEVPDSEADPQDALLRVSDADALKACLARLEPARRASLLLAYVDGYSHPQIAARLDVPVGTVKAWIRRSLAALRQCLT